MGEPKTLSTVAAPATTDLAAIRVQDDAMAPIYCPGDVLLYRRPDEHLALQPGDDVLVLLAGPGGSLQLVLRRLIHWDRETLELHAINPSYPPIREHPRNAVLCGQVTGQLSQAVLH